MSGGKRESSNYHDASYSNSSVWRFPNLWLILYWRCYDGCFCFGWLPLLLNKDFWENLHHEKWLENIVMEGYIYVWMEGSWVKQNTKGSWNDPTMSQEVWKGPHLFKRFYGRCWVCFQVYCGFTDKTSIAWLRHIRLYLSTPGGRSPKFLWWEGHGHLCRLLGGLNFSKVLPSHRVI